MDNNILINKLGKRKLSLGCCSEVTKFAKAQDNERECKVKFLCKNKAKSTSINFVPVQNKLDNVL
jgi:hypothetical protein